MPRNTGSFIIEKSFLKKPQQRFCKRCSSAPVGAEEGYLLEKKAVERNYAMNPLVRICIVLSFVSATTALVWKPPTTKKDTEVSKLDQDVMVHLLPPPSSQSSGKQAIPLGSIELFQIPRDGASELGENATNQAYGSGQIPFTTAAAHQARGKQPTNLWPWAATGKLQWSWGTNHFCVMCCSFCHNS